MEWRSKTYWYRIYNDSLYWSGTNTSSKDDFNNINAITIGSSSTSKTWLS